MIDICSIFRKSNKFRRRSGVWILLAIFLLGPLFFWSGFQTGRQIQSRKAQNERLASSSPAKALLDSTTDGETLVVLLKTEQVLRSSEPPICASESSQHNNTKNNVEICLQLESDGNLILYSKWKDTDENVNSDTAAANMLWTSQTKYRSDEPSIGARSVSEYATVLQTNGILVTTKLTDTTTITENGNVVVWQSQLSPSIDAEYQLVWHVPTQEMQISRNVISISSTSDAARIVLWGGTTLKTWINVGNSSIDNSEDGASDDDFPSNNEGVADNILWSPQPTMWPTSTPTIVSGGVVTFPTITPTTMAMEPVFDVPSFIPDFELDLIDSSTSLIPGSENKLPWPERDMPLSTRFALRSGPLVGHVTDHSVRLWALQGENRPLQIHYRPTILSGDDRNIDGSVLLMPPNADQGSSLLEINNLLPDKSYEYLIYIQDELVGQGSWKTASNENQPTSFQFLLASCMDVKGHRHPQQPVWDEVSQQGRPDFAILNGDTVYLNDGDWTPTEKEILLERVWYRNLAQRDEQHFAKFISHVPTYAVWDDHEYGTNNSDKDQKGKHNSLRAFTNLWPNPSAGTSDAEGVFYSFYRGDVHFIVCDNRWYRDLSTGRQFGDKQMDWIEQQLTGSNGIFKIIVSGGDVMERRMSTDADAIGRIVTQHQISGVLFAAGDIHRNEFKAMDNINWPYKVTQISSSGIAREWRRPWAIVKVDTTTNNSRKQPFVQSHFYGAEDMSQTTTWSNDPSLVCSRLVANDLDGEHRCTEIILLSDLTP